jgi:hypothetical protein
VQQALGDGREHLQVPCLELSFSQTKEMRVEKEPLFHEVKCPKCSLIVDRVDGEYERHYVVANILCTSSRREIEKKDTAAMLAEVEQWNLPGGP